MKIFYLPFLLLFSAVLHAQEICDNGIDDDGDSAIDLLDSECTCASASNSITADFEENICCPDNITFEPGTGYFCVNDEWDFASDATTDYFNTCNFIGGNDIVPLVPLPIPSGNGATGFASSQDGYNEGIARCLDCTLIGGETYDVSFFAGFNTAFGITSSSPVEFAIYGKTNCNNIPAPGFNCLEGSGGWTELGTFTAVGTLGDWVQVTGSFTAPFDVAALAFSKSCGYVAGPDHSSSLQEYHFMDALEITGNFEGPNCGGTTPPSVTADLNGDCLNGYTLTATPAGALSYQWYIDGIAIVGAIANPWIIDPLVEGDYQVLATFADGTCAISDPIPFNPDGETLNIDAAVSNPTCFGETNGAITLNIDSPNPPFDIDWNTGSNAIFLDNLAAGTYSATVTDANGCTGTYTTTLSAANEIFVNVNITQPNENQGGSVDLFATGGAPPFQYEWSNGLIGPIQTDLLPGVYSVTITDANGCEEVIQVEIFAPLLVDVSASPEVCLDACDAVISITATGGLAPYSYAWSNGASTSIQENLCAGVYSITITDNTGNSFTEFVDINPGNSFSLDLVNTGTTCTNQLTTDLDLTVLGGQAPFNFDWSNGATSEDLFAVPTGTYAVLVTDALGCEATIDIIIPPVEALAITPFITDISCNSPEGSIELTVTGGEIPYTFNWNNGQTGAQLFNLQAGAYTVTLTDNLGCTLEEVFTVAEQTQLSLSANVTDVACAGQASGFIDLIITGGIAPFAISWSNGQNVEDLNGLIAGEYSVTVTDANGCVSVDTYTLNTLSFLDTSAE